MSALCIREMSGHRAAAHTGAGFKHGPNLDVDASHVAIIFALGRAAELGVKLAQECNRRGGKVVLVSSEEHNATEKLFPVRIEAVPEPWEGITSLLVPQALTLAMVERTGCRLTAALPVRRNGTVALRMADYWRIETAIPLCRNSRRGRGERTRSLGFARDDKGEGCAH
jgi:fructoselysine-6-P-deglycase FrlB-like protein